MSKYNISDFFLQKIKKAKKEQLERLDLSSNYHTHDSQKLVEIPLEVFELTQLKILILNYNKIYYVSESISKLINLSELYIRNNQLSCLPESIGNLSNLTRLALNNNRLSCLPESIGNLSNLTRLALNNNQLSYLPESIGNLSNLTRLALNNNQLSYLPESIGNLSNLTELYLNNNQLSYLPESIGNLSNLTRLALNNNQFTDFPKSITKIFTLKELDFASNQFNKIPDFIDNLSNLTTLDLNSNQLSYLPESIGNISCLSWLYLNNNRLVNLPESISQLSKLTKLHISFNPLSTPPIEVAERGLQAIKKYFRQLKKEGKDYIYEAKLLIVGEAGAGKTTLAKKIQNLQYQLRENQASTEGIDVIKWSFPLDNEREFKVNIWDFGGQEIYHATHQFFLTKRSLYTLVADTRKEDTDFYYWLSVVELLSDNSPLLIVKNEKQERQREINERALKGQFSNLKETLATNLATNRGLEVILAQIKHYISNLPHIGQTLPKTWVKVRQALENDVRNYISLQKYLDICEANRFTKLEDKLQLSGYLHDLGVCLHFQDEEDSVLYKTVILKPEWGTDAVYKVLDSKQVVNNKGCFTRNDLKNIWQEEKYASARGELLELMKKFQLCYEIPSRKDTFIAPQLLSDNQSEYDWDESDNLILRYSYPDFIPKGIISRFIVVMHQYIDRQIDVWKSGVILNKNNAKAEVIENYGKREIVIRAVGTEKRDLMTIITHELDKINDSYNKRLNYQKLIPCNCEVCKNSQNPHAYEYNQLLERIEHNKWTIECGKPPYEEVKVFDLINRAIDLKQLISQYSNKSIIFDDGIQQVNFLSIENGNYYEQKGDNNTMSKDRSRTQNISGGTINNSGAGAFSLGDISGTVANTINQLPNFENEPDKKQLKELLDQLQTAVKETELDEEEKAESLEQVKVIAESLQNSQDGVVKKTAKRAMKFLRGTAAALPPGAAMVTICNQLPELISKIF